MDDQRKAIIYCRISRDVDGTGLGVERQEMDCRDLAQRVGWEIVRVETDNDISAYSGKLRPGYQRMLASIEVGEANAIIAWHTDRLHRQPLELESFIPLIEKYGVAIQTVKAGVLDLSTNSGQMVARILGAAARHEVDQTRTRAKRAKQAAAVAGKFRGGVRPFGYESDGMTLREPEAQMIREGTTAVIRGASSGTIVRAWNSTGVYGTRGRPWTHPSVRQVLVRARNAGKIEMAGVIQGDALWPALVDLETLLAVRAVFADPSRKTSPGNQRKWLGSGLYVCELTGTTMTCTQQGAGPNRIRYNVYRDKFRQRGGAVIHAEEIDYFVEQTILARLERPDAIALILPDGVDVQALRDSQSGLQARLAEAMGLFASGVITGAELAGITGTIKAEIESVESALANARSSSELASFVLADGDLRRRWETDLDVSTKARVIDLLATITVRPQNRRNGRNRLPFDPDRVSITPR